METPIARLARWLVRQQETCIECGAESKDLVCSKACADKAAAWQRDLAW
jgi:hypothetical protein